MKNFMFKSLNKAISTPIAIIIVIVVGLLAIGGVLAYQYYWQAPEEETPEEIPTDETAGWEVYQNEDYGYEVKYPSGAKKREFDEERYRGDVYFYYDCYNNSNVTYITFRVNIYNRNGLSLEEWLDQTECVDLSRCEKISFGGIQGLKPPGGHYAVSSCPPYSAYTIKDSKVYALQVFFGELLPQPIKPILECTEDTFKKMLSTFRFID